MDRDQTRFDRLQSEHVRRFGVPTTAVPLFGRWLPYPFEPEVPALQRPPADSTKRVQAVRTAGSVSELPADQLLLVHVRLGRAQRSPSIGEGGAPLLFRPLVASRWSAHAGRLALVASLQLARKAGLFLRTTDNWLRSSCVCRGRADLPLHQGATRSQPSLLTNSVYTGRQLDRARRHKTQIG